jgi:hypothetical protein
VARRAARAVARGAPSRVVAAVRVEGRQAFDHAAELRRAARGAQQADREAQRAAARDREALHRARERAQHAHEVAPAWPTERAAVQIEDREPRDGGILAVDEHVQRGEVRQREARGGDRAAVPRHALGERVRAAARREAGAQLLAGQFGEQAVARRPPRAHRDHARCGEAARRERLRDGDLARGVVAATRPREAIAHEVAELRAGERLEEVAAAVWRADREDRPQAVRLGHGLPTGERADAREVGEGGALGVVRIDEAPALAHGRSVGR